MAALRAGGATVYFGAVQRHHQVAALQRQLLEQAQSPTAAFAEFIKSIRTHPPTAIRLKVLDFFDLFIELST